MSRHRLIPLDRRATGLGSRRFDVANSEYLEVDSAPVTDEPFSMSCWFQVADVSVQRTLMGIFNSVSDGFRHYLSASAGSTIDAASKIFAQTRLASTSTTFSTNTWHHACGVWASDSSRAAYLDGGGKGTETT